jgi:hypothetical protein
MKIIDGSKSFPRDRAMKLKRGWFCKYKIYMQTWTRLKWRIKFTDRAVVSTEIVHTGTGSMAEGAIGGGVLLGPVGALVGGDSAR